MANRVDKYQHHDYYQIDDLLSDEHILARQAVRDWVKQEVSPIIEDYAEKAECPMHLFKGLAEIGAFGPSLPTEYGGGGMDETAYGVIMQELERGDSGVRSMASVQGSLVM
jgi:glutaryl-CoA dehydrogenase